MAKDAPWFLPGVAARTRSSPFAVHPVLTVVMMLVAVLVAAYGVVRVKRSWLGLRET